MFTAVIIFPSSKMAALRKQGKLASVYRKNHEDDLMDNKARNTNFPTPEEVYVTQVAEKTEVRMTMKRFRESSRTEIYSLGALLKIVKFLLNAPVRVHSGPVLESSRKSNRENRGMKESRSQNDPHPDVSVSLSQFLQELRPEVTPYVNLRESIHTLFGSEFHVQCKYLFHGYTTVHLTETKNLQCSVRFVPISDLLSAEHIFRSIHGFSRSIFCPHCRLVFVAARL